jgi:hypothetical protein
MVTPKLTDTIRIRVPASIKRVFKDANISAIIRPLLLSSELHQFLIDERVSIPATIEEVISTFFQEMGRYVEKHHKIPKSLRIVFDLQDIGPE